MTRPVERPERAFVAPAVETPIEPARVPTVSVVIPAYQAAATIGDALASALGQTRPPLEVIVSDDGSTDGLEQAIAPFADRVRYLRGVHRGVAAARNRGLRAASGDLVAILDSDDVWLPGYLEAVGDLGAARPDLDLLSTDVFFELDGRIVGRFYEENDFDVLDQRRAILKGCFVGWPVARRERLLEIGGFDESLAVASDWDGWIRMVLTGARAGLVREPLMRYRLHGGSLSAERARSLRARIAVIDKTRARPDIGPSEIETLETSRSDAVRRAGLAEARQALSEGRSGARRRALALALGRGVPARARFELALAAARRSPAGHLVERDERAPRSRREGTAVDP